MKMFLPGHIYRRTDPVLGASIHVEPGRPKIGLIKVGDEFLVLEVRRHPEYKTFNWIHVLGCNREFMGWSPTDPIHYAEVTDVP